LTLALSEYLTELRDWNARGNLVSQSDLGRLVSRHVAESFAALPYVDRPEVHQVIDVGSGGGFPIVPLKLARPELRVALVESRRMKSLFLRRIATRLDLSSFWVWSMRIESLAELPLDEHGGTLEEVARSATIDTPTVRPTVDLVTVRAVAPLSDLARWSERLVSTGGRLLAFKGSRLDEELNQWKRAPEPWRLEDITPVSPEIKLVSLVRE
jgi:16S rRNA (guanine527-N7)-methyltransferase